MINPLMYNTYIRGYFSVDLIRLFPLDCTGGLWSEVVEDPVNTVYLCWYSLGDLLEEVKRNVFNGCGHGIGCIDCTDDNGISEGTLAVFNTD